MSQKVAVIGGGAAGMMAAIFSAEKGDDVTVFEKNQKIGRKLYITGKGRCNLTNNCDIRTVISSTLTNPRFLYSALSRFSPADTMDFFEKNGLPLKVERGNRVFPISDKASDVVDLLLRKARETGCRIIHETVEDIVINDRRITGVVYSGNTEPFDKVVIATGGLSYPATGSTGDGYRFAEKAGHRIIPPRPALVPLVTVEEISPRLSGLLLKNISVSVRDTVRDKVIFSEFGEMQFTVYGLAGPLILSASSNMKEMSSGKYRIEIDLKPALTPEKLDSRLLREISDPQNKKFSDVVRKLLPSEMVAVFIRKTGIPEGKSCSEIRKTERTAVVEFLKKFTFTVHDFRPIEEAIVTSGGVDVREIDPKTMQSKLVSGLFFAGEVMDVDSYTGGFNLQTAFSTGVLAAG